MIREKELSRPDRIGLSNIEKINDILIYLYTGNTVEHKGNFYRMDGDFNPYIVPLKEDFKTPLDKVDNGIPLFQNAEFWNTLVEMAEDFTEEDMKEIKLQRAIIKTLNKS